MIPSPSFNPFRYWTPRRVSLAAGFLAVVGFLTCTGTNGQRLNSSIGPQDSKALLSISRTLAVAPNATSQNLFQIIGYPPGTPPPGWATFPTVRKIEAAYLAAEQRTPGQGTNVLALLARSLAQQYDGVKYDPNLAEYLAMATAGQPTYETIVSGANKPELKVQKAILAISRYAEGSHLGGAAGILQYYFNLPPEVAYGILRSSPTSEVALARGLERVPLERRHARLELLVSHLDQTFPDTAVLERDLDPYRRSKTEDSALIPVKTDHTHRPDDSPGVPNTSTGGGPSPSSGNNGEQPAEYKSFTERPQDAYESRVPEWYGPRPVEFVEMVEVEGGFGGVVFGNAFKSLVQKHLDQVEYLPLTATEGQLVFSFSDGSQATFGPALGGDIYAAYRIVYGDGKSSPPLGPKQGVGLLGIEHGDPHYDLIEDRIATTGDTYFVIVHPALSHVGLGLSTLMSDVLPIGSDISRPKLEALIGGYDEAKLPQIEWAMPFNVTDWKITDAQVTISLQQDQMIVGKLGQTGRSGAFLSIYEYRKQKTKYDLSLTPRFEHFADLLTTVSSDYRHLSEFVPVFDLLRWAHEQGVVALANAPVLPADQKPTVPDWIIDQDDGYTLLFNEVSASPLENLRAKLDQRLTELRGTAPEESQEQLKAFEAASYQYLKTMHAIELLEDQKETALRPYYQAGNNLRARILSSDIYKAKYEALFEEIYSVENSLSDEADMAGPTKQRYDELIEKLIKMESSLLPSDAARIRQRNLIASEYRIKESAPLRDAQKARGEIPDRQKLSVEVATLLPADQKGACSDADSALKALSSFDETGEATKASDALDEIDSQISTHFASATPAVKRKFDSYSDDNWDEPDFDAFLLKEAPSLREARKQAVLRITTADAQRAKASGEVTRTDAACKASIASYFPDFDKWSGLLYSIREIRP
jgi:hypothetical protein